MFTIHEGVLGIIKLLEEITLDAQKFDEGNFVAGRRTRKKLSEVVSTCKELRAGILSIQKKRKL